MPSVCDVPGTLEEHCRERVDVLRRATARKVATRVKVKACLCDVSNNTHRDGISKVSIDLVHKCVCGLVLRPVSVIGEVGVRQTVVRRLRPVPGVAEEGSGHEGGCDDGALSWCAREAREDTIAVGLSLRRVYMRGTAFALSGPNKQHCETHPKVSSR